mmetsp:Transcript_28050/g.59582  ORF Transcript_28050/g.59582 Transcript_28050/m.59582 type:complete len:368 (-) Transcript_28050:82-1185(-)
MLVHHPRVVATPLGTIKHQLLIQSNVPAVTLAITPIYIGVILGLLERVVRVRVGHALIEVHPLVGATSGGGGELVRVGAVLPVKLAHSQVEVRVVHHVGGPRRRGPSRGGSRRTRSRSRLLGGLCDRLLGGLPRRLLLGLRCPGGLGQLGGLLRRPPGRRPPRPLRPGGHRRGPLGRPPCGTIPQLAVVHARVVLLDHPGKLAALLDGPEEVRVELRVPVAAPAHRVFHVGVVDVEGWRTGHVGRSVGGPGRRAPREAVSVGRLIGVRVRQRPDARGGCPVLEQPHRLPLLFQHDHEGAAGDGVLEVVVDGVEGGRAEGDEGVGLARPVALHEEGQLEFELLGFQPPPLFLWLLLLFFDNNDFATSQ